jgi:DNA-binding response OmpR family regulator
LGTNEQPAYTLIVGPDNRDRAWAEGTLLRGGLDVATATEVDALVARDLAPPKLLIIDDSGTRPDRMGTLRRLQTHPALKGVPLLVLAYDSDIDSFTDAITRGASAYLVKPVSGAELLRVAQRLSGWVGTSESQERRRRVRRPLLMRIEVHLRAEETKVLGQLLDASGSGCRIEVPVRVVPGDALRVVLQGQDASTHVALGVEVRWSRPGAAGCVAGCRFTGTTALLAGKILGFVSSGLT